MNKSVWRKLKPNLSSKRQIYSAGGNTGGKEMADGEWCCRASGSRPRCILTKGKQTARERSWSVRRQTSLSQANKNTDLWSDLEEGVGWVKTPWYDYCGGRKNTDASWSPYPYAKGQLGVQQWPPILEAGQRLCESIPQLRGWSPKRNDAKKFPDSGQQSPFSFGSSFRKKHCQRPRLLWALNRPTFGLSLQITFYGPHHLSCPCGQK